MFNFFIYYEREMMMRSLRHEKILEIRVNRENVSNQHEKKNIFHD